MSPKIIELKQAPVVLIELSQKETLAGISQGVLYYYGEMMNKDDYPYSLYLDYPISLVGILSDLTEEQFAECVRKHATLGLYRDYTSIYEAPTRVFMMPTAKGSFNTLRTCEDITYTGEVVVSKSSLTIDPKRTVVLLRKEEQ